MIYNYKGKNLNIPNDFLKNAQEKLGLTTAEAIQMYLEDEGYEINAEQEELVKKAKENGVQKQMTRVTSNRKSQTKRERKPDPTKEEIIKNLAEHLENFVENVQIENVGKIISFNIGDEHFTLNLVRNRQKKNKGE